MSVPDQVKTIVSLTFFDEPDKRVEFNHWQYWYNLQPNPNQRAFDIGKVVSDFLVCLYLSICGVHVTRRVHPVCSLVIYLSHFADRKSCENLQGKPDDIAYNATSFTWCPEQVVKVSNWRRRVW